MKIKAIDLSKTTDVSDILKRVSEFSDATTEEISDVFSMGINPDIKKRFDYAGLFAILADISRYEEYLSSNPDKYVSEKQRFKENMHLSDEESDKLRPDARQPWLYFSTRLQANIDDFIFKSEDIIGKTTCMNDIKKIDGIYDCITLIKPRLKNKNGKYINNHDNIENYGFSSLITNIRNGLMHNSYIIYGRNVYINNPEGGKDGKGFQAVVSSEFFEHMYGFGREVSRKPQITSVYYKIDIKWKKGYEANKDNLGMRITDTNKSNELMNFADQGKHLVGNGVTRIGPLSPGKKELLKGFFEKNDFCEEKLLYAIMGMAEASYLGVDCCHNTSPSIREKYLLGIRDKYLMLNSDSSLSTQGKLWQILTEGDDINKRLIWDDEEYLIEDIKPLDGGDRNKEELSRLKRYIHYMKSLLEIHNAIIFVDDRIRLDYLKILYISKFFVNNPTLELAEAQKREGFKLKNQCTNYIMDNCKNKPDMYRSKESKQSNLNKLFGRNYWLNIFKQFTSGQLSKDQIIQRALEDRRISLDQKEILKDNIITVIEKWEKQLDEVTIIQEPEHIRNAFAHHNYTIIPGYNKILLEDPSRDDFPDWRKIYDLDELYQSCLDKTDECFLGIKK